MGIENKNSYRIKQSICVILGLCAALLITCVVGTRQEVVKAKAVADAQEELAGNVFRFHVLANSDSKEDQELKLFVRDGILSYMRESFSKENEMTLGETKAWAITHLDEIQCKAQEIVWEKGYNYSVEVNVEKCYFPDRKYGNVLFPKGYYEALRIKIGSARGHNWWCVLYPSLCFVDATCAVVTEEGENKLEDELCDTTFETITAASDNFKIKSFFYELFKERTDRQMEEGQ